MVHGNKKNNNDGNLYFIPIRFRVYFQEIICFCCLRLWKSRHKSDVPSGILLNKNFNSEFGRTRSCKYIFKVIFVKIFNDIQCQDVCYTPQIPQLHSVRTCKIFIKLNPKRSRINLMNFLFLMFFV